VLHYQYFLLVISHDSSYYWALQPASKPNFISVRYSPILLNSTSFTQSLSKMIRATPSRDIVEILQFSTYKRGSFLLFNRRKLTRKEEPF
jgi:hypothetical protein